MFTTKKVEFYHELMFMVISILDWTECEENFQMKEKTIKKQDIITFTIEINGRL
jgi:hypothetical protein